MQVIDTPNALCLVTEYAGGGELFEHVNKKGRLDETESCRLFHAIVRCASCRFDTTDPVLMVLLVCCLYPAVEWNTVIA